MRIEILPVFFTYWFIVANIWLQKQELCVHMAFNTSS